MKQLDTELFKTVVANTPLVSIDLVVQDSASRILLGLRINRPAQGYWFVPGGRIRKDETITQAFARLVNDELGVVVSVNDAEYLGTYEHFYQDNFSGEGFYTHYVVLGYRLRLDIDLQALPHEQHGHYQWLSVSELLASKQVHSNTKLYFQNT